MTFGGRSVAAASVEIGMEEVFDARIASGGSDLVRLPEDLLFDLGVLDDRFDHQLRLDDPVDRLDARKHPGRVGSALLRELLEAAPHGLQAPLDGAGSSVVQGHAAARCGQHLGDTTAHLAGADDQHVVECHEARG